MGFFSKLPSFKDVSLPKAFTIKRVGKSKDAASEVTGDADEDSISENIPFPDHPNGLANSADAGELQVPAGAINPDGDGSIVDASSGTTSGGNEPKLLFPKKPEGPSPLLAAATQMQHAHSMAKLWGVPVEQVIEKTKRLNASQNPGPPRATSMHQGSNRQQADQSSVPRARSMATGISEIQPAGEPSSQPAQPSLSNANSKVVAAKAQLEALKARAATRRASEIRADRTSEGMYSNTSTSNVEALLALTGIKMAAEGPAEEAAPTPNYSQAGAASAGMDTGSMRNSDIMKITDPVLLQQMMASVQAELAAGADAGAGTGAGAGSAAMDTGSLQDSDIMKITDPVLLQQMMASVQAELAAGAVAGAGAVTGAAGTGAGTDSVTVDTGSIRDSDIMKITDPVLLEQMMASVQAELAAGAGAGAGADAVVGTGAVAGAGSVTVDTGSIRDSDIVKITDPVLLEQMMASVQAELAAGAVAGAGTGTGAVAVSGSMTVDTGSMRDSDIMKITDPVLLEQMMASVQAELAELEHTREPNEGGQESNQQPEVSAMSLLHNPSAKAMSLLDNPSAKAMSLLDNPSAKAMSLLDNPSAKVISLPDTPPAKAISLTDNPSAKAMSLPENLSAKALDGLGVTQAARERALQLESFSFGPNAYTSIPSPPQATQPTSPFKPQPEPLPLPQTLAASVHQAVHQPIPQAVHRASDTSGTPHQHSSFLVPMPARPPLPEVLEHPQFGTSPGQRTESKQAVFQVAVAAIPPVVTVAMGTGTRPPLASVPTGTDELLSTPMDSVHQAVPVRKQDASTSTDPASTSIGPSTSKHQQRTQQAPAQDASTSTDPASTSIEPSTSKHQHRTQQAPAQNASTSTDPVVLGTEQDLGPLNHWGAGKVRGSAASSPSPHRASPVEERDHISHTSPPSDSPQYSASPDSGRRAGNIQPRPGYSRAFLNASAKLLHGQLGYPQLQGRTQAQLQGQLHAQAGTQAPLSFSDAAPQLEPPVPSHIPSRSQSITGLAPMARSANSPPRLSRPQVSSGSPLLAAPPGSPPWQPPPGSPPWQAPSGSPLLAAPPGSSPWQALPGSPPWQAPPGSSLLPGPTPTTPATSQPPSQGAGASPRVVTPLSLEGILTNMTCSPHPHARYSRPKSSQESLASYTSSPLQPTSRETALDPHARYSRPKSSQESLASYTSSPLQPTSRETALDPHARYSRPKSSQESLASYTSSPLQPTSREVASEVAHQQGPLQHQHQSSLQHQHQHRSPPHHHHQPPLHHQYQGPLHHHHHHQAPPHSTSSLDGTSSPFHHQAPPHSPRGFGGNHLPQYSPSGQTASSHGALNAPPAWSLEQVSTTVVPLGQHYSSAATTHPQDAPVPFTSRPHEVCQAHTDGHGDILGMSSDPGSPTSHSTAPWGRDATGGEWQLTGGEGLTPRSPSGEGLSPRTPRKWNVLPEELFGAAVLAATCSSLKAFEETDDMSLRANGHYDDFQFNGHYDDSQSCGSSEKVEAWRPGQQVEGLMPWEEPDLAGSNSNFKFQSLAGTSDGGGDTSTQNGSSATQDKSPTTLTSRGHIWSPVGHQGKCNPRQDRDHAQAYPQSPEGQRSAGSGSTRSFFSAQPSPVDHAHLIEVQQRARKLLSEIREPSPVPELVPKQSSVPTAVLNLSSLSLYRTYTKEVGAQPEEDAGNELNLQAPVGLPEPSAPSSQGPAASVPGRRGGRGRYAPPRAYIW